MSPHQPNDASETQPLDEVEVLAAQFLTRLRAGEDPDREAVVRAHPHLGARLDRRLALVEMTYHVGLAPEGSARNSPHARWPSTLSPNLSPQQPRTVTADEGDSGAPGGSRDLGDYEIVCQLGQGGMGVVYKARQKSLNRLVALKMVRAGAHAGADLLARFYVEAEALASLHHPNIVQVHEVGTHDECPFLAMELLDGGSLSDSLADRAQPPAATAKLVETLARAVHAAHLRGVVHRDLKPANILFDREGQPHVTDFGLAKRLAERKSHTVTGSVIGTPSYMAPEQAEGRTYQIGPPTDVYALGAILYEMLTGQPPFRGKTGIDTLKRVVSEEPTAPSRLRPKVPCDLETICLKCLSKEPARRYATALDLADDLRRYQDGAPIAARPVGLGERAWKWGKRRPTLAALLGVSLAAGAALAVVGISWAVQVRAERDRADRNLKVARRAIDDLYVKMASDRLFDEPQLDPLCRELLEKAQALYEDLAQENSSSTEVRRAVALAWFHLGDIHRLREQDEQAEQAYGEAIARQEELRRAHPEEPRYRQDLANSHNWLGELLREGNRPGNTAEQHYLAALELQQELAQQYPEEPLYRLELARSHYNLGIVQRNANRRAAAAMSYDRAVKLLSELRKGDSANANTRQDLARALINCAALHRLCARLPEAGRDGDRAIDLLTGLRAEFPNRAAYKFELAIARQNRGNVFWDLGRHGDAQRQHREALTLLDGLVADYSGRRRYRMKLGNALKNLGASLASAGNRPGAEQCWNRARALFEALAREYPKDADYHGLLGMTLGNLGWLRSEQDKLPEARRLIGRGIAEVQAALAPNPQHPDYRHELRNQYQDLAEICVQLGDHAAAADAATKLANVFPERGLDSYYAACFVARCVPLAPKKGKTATAYVERALRLLRRTIASPSPDLKRLAKEPQYFQPLARHPDFAEVMRALEKKAPLATDRP
jgi:tetratricopeptide (TPR) repeat protein